MRPFVVGGGQAFILFLLCLFSFIFILRLGLGSLVVSHTVAPFRLLQAGADYHLQHSSIAP